MRRQKRRPLHYIAICLYDGTVTAAYPVRKPTPKKIKQDKLRIDEDGICDRGWYRDGKELSDVNNENRTRIQDIISNRLNTRRAIRELVIPELSKIQEDMNDMRNQLNQIQELITNQS